MKNKLILFAFMLCMGVFIFPVTAFAASETDTTPPTITATINGDVLHIEAVDGESGVEAVFIDNKRINYRVDSALDLDYTEYAENGEYISVYAIDFAGNKSKIVTLKNPLFAAPIIPPEPKPFTPAGTGTVMDNATDGDGKEFFTITTPDENVFYLVIDRQRSSENVYLLNAVTEDDLAALAKKGDKKPSETAIPTDPTPAPKPEPEPEPEPEQKPKSNNGTVIFLVLAVVAVGGAGYYFKVYKPKQQAPIDDYDEDEEMEFEEEQSDEQEETEAYSDESSGEETDEK